MVAARGMPTGAMARRANAAHRTEGPEPGGYGTAAYRRPPEEGAGAGAASRTRACALVVSVLFAAACTAAVIVALAVTDAEVVGRRHPTTSPRPCCSATWRTAIHSTGRCANTCFDRDA